MLNDTSCITGKEDIHCKTESIGKSYEGLDIIALRVRLMGVF